MRVTLYLLLLFVMGCAQVSSLNLKRQQFALQPTKIVWIQVAGLSKEHLAMLRFSYPTADTKTSFEMATCTGDSWGYNLYQLRSSSYKGLRAQSTGSQNIKGDCTDFEQKPLWSYLMENGYKSAYFESGARADESILRANLCKHPEYIQGLSVWSMSKAPKKYKKFFHVTDRERIEDGEVRYDKACASGTCFSTISENVKSLYERYQWKRSHNFFMVRDFTYEKLIKAGKIKKAREHLSDIDKLHRFFLEKSKEDDSLLVLFTSTSPRRFEFPREGREWSRFEKTGKPLIFRRSGLLSPVFATGARTENFCGIYEDAAIFQRIVEKFEPKGLGIMFVNPFK